MMMMVMVVVMLMMMMMMMVQELIESTDLGVNELEESEAASFVTF